MDWSCENRKLILYIYICYKHFPYLFDKFAENNINYFISTDIFHNHKDISHSFTTQMTILMNAIMNSNTLCLPLAEHLERCLHVYKCVLTRVIFVDTYELICICIMGKGITALNPSFKMLYGVNIYIY